MVLSSYTGDRPGLDIVQKNDNNPHGNEETILENPINGNETSIDGPLSPPNVFTEQGNLKWKTKYEMPKKKKQEIQIIRVKKNLKGNTKGKQIKI